MAVTDSQGPGNLVVFPWDPWCREGDWPAGGALTLSRGLGGGRAPAVGGRAASEDVREDPDPVQLTRSQELCAPCGCPSATRVSRRPGDCIRGFHSWPFESSPLLPFSPWVRLPVTCQCLLCLEPFCWVLEGQAETLEVRPVPGA